MGQVIITKAENGYVTEVRDNGTNTIYVFSTLAKTVKAIKELYKDDSEEVTQGE